jgi:MoaA/NifB/PqqE/SkfB family radical SAM enzyme
MNSFPKYIQIETSIVCNSNCVFCPHKEMERGPNYMEERIWKKIIDESRGKGIIYRPFMINEPFVDLRLPEIIRYIKQDNTAKVEFNSNGNFHPQFDVAAALEAGIDWIRFSVDGFTEETFKKSGRGGKFDKIVSNVLAFIEEQNLNNSNLLITGSNLLMKPLLPSCMIGHGADKLIVTVLPVLK